MPTNEAVSSRITRLNQLLSGKTSGKKVPLLDKETLLDAFVALYNECNTDYMTKDKNIATYVKKFKPLICEIEKLRLKKNDFEIRKTIGRGHFGEVHVVREKITGNVYAMKVLKKSETLSQDNVAFFEEERDIMAFAGNPWITSLQYAFQDYESLYLVMDFHPGGDLLSLLAKYDDIFEENIAQFYLAEMIMAMHAVHALGYVHRDIKPENVLIDRTGHIKLADFGSSAKLSSAKTVVSKMPVGTPEYIAPEVLTSMDGSGGGGKYGIECDWWSLGVVAYEMMIGVTPFQADSVVVVYSQIMSFKDSLSFPDDQPLTDNAKSLIRSLLTDQRKRIGYQGLAKHPFFTGLDWTTLQDAVPPYVPNVQREDDTSNFDDFETESSGPRIEDFMEQKRGFIGKDLPFIGFTFTKQLTVASLNETIETSVQSHGTLKKRASTKRESTKDNGNSQLIALKVDIEKEQKKSKELKVVLEDKIKLVRKIENERNQAENDNALLKSEKKDLQRLYEKEIAKREKLHHELELMKEELVETNQKMDAIVSEKINSSNEESQELIQQLEQEKSSLLLKLQHLETDLNDNKKSLDDSKSRINDLQTKLAKVNEDTKTNVSDLQQKLQKVTADNESRIKQFQEKLAKAVLSAQDAVDQLGKAEQEKEYLEKELSYLQSINCQADSTKEIETLQQDIQHKVSLNEKLQGDNKRLQIELDESRTKYDQLVEFGEDLKLQVERKLEKLQKELSFNRKEMKKKEDEYKRLKDEYDSKSANLNLKESKIATLEATCSSLQGQLEELKNDKEISTKDFDENVQLERMELTRRMSEMNTEKSQTEKENVILNQDLSQARIEIEKLKCSLENINRQLDESTDNFESTVMKLNRDVLKLTDENKKYREQAREYQGKTLDMERNLLLLKEAEDKVTKANVAIDNLRTDKKALEKKLQQSTDNLEKASKEKEQLYEELNEKERQANSQDLTVQMLKQTCTMLEGQVEELEVMNDEYQDREATWNLIKRQQYQAQEQLEQQLNETLVSLEQQRQQKNQATTKLRQLEEMNMSAQGDTQKKVEHLETLNKSQDDRIQELNAMLSDAEKKAGLNLVTIRSLERKLAIESEEKEKLSSEISHLEDLSAQQTSSNFQLTVEIEQLKEQNDEINLEKDNVQNQLERNAFQHAEEKIKMESTLAQQSKLIDFLQKKVMIDNKNFIAVKKPKGKNIKGKLEHVPVENQVDMRKTRDLERALEKEKNANLQHHLQLQKARDELGALRAEMQQYKLNAKTSSNPTTPRMMHKQDVRKVSSTNLYAKTEDSPSTSVADIYNMADYETRANSSVLSSAMEVKNPNHNPHRLQATLNMRPAKCPVCLNTVHFAKQAMKCSECHLVVHSKCSSSLQNLCGVPKSLISHFYMDLSRKSMILDDGTVAIDVTDGPGKLPKVESWLKFPRKSSVKQGWERKWVVLSDMKLSIYENENTEEFDPVDGIELNILEGELNIHPAIPSSELIWVAGNDIHYVFSVEIIPYSLGWPRRTLYFLPPTFSDKQKWVSALEYVADEVKKTTQKEGHGMVKDVIFTLDGAKHLDVSCAALLSKTGCVLGSEDGLHVVSMKPGPHQYKPLQIVGLGPVYQLQVLHALDLMLVITGKERLFSCVGLKDLESRLRQSQMGSTISAITSSQIERVKSCHLFACSKVGNDYYACAATTHKLNILIYNPSTQSFVLKKELETNESASCLLFTPNAVIYGTSKFHTADIKSFQKRDFLDASDTSLAFAVFGTTQTRSFPLAIFKVSQDKPRDEYLLCFSEFGIFVDWQGRRSRKGDLKWSRLPMAFEYHHPHLYITHFASIEICEISTDVKFDISATPRRFVDVPDPRFIGQGFQNNSVLFASTQKNKLEIICYKAPPPIGLSRNMSVTGVNISSGASVANAILEQSGISLDPLINRSGSSSSICSDEETSISIGKLTPRSNRRDNIRNESKDRNRISFRFFKNSRRSQYDG